MRARAFTMIELMVAAAIAFIVVATGAQLAASMVRATRKYEEQAELGARVGLTAAFLKAAVSSAAYNWTVEQINGATGTGSFGIAHCAPSTNICSDPANHQMRALEICGPGMDSVTCPAQTTNAADGVKTIVPRDGIIEAVRIEERNGTVLPNDCNMGTGAITFDVKGSTSRGWATNDLVLVTNNNHVSIARVNAAFAANTDPATLRQLVLDLGDTTKLSEDDGGRSTACSGKTSLKGAKVMRIKQVMVRHDNTAKAIQYAEKLTSAASPTFTSLVTDVEDLGIQLEMVRVPAGATPTGSTAFCTMDSNFTNVFAGGTVLQGACNGEKLNGDSAAGTLIRVVGMRMGVTMRSRVETQTINDAVSGIFDRSGTVVNDKRLHRKSFFYVGLPNANAF